MGFKLIFTDEAKGQLGALNADQRMLKKVKKCLGLIETDPKHPGLNSHKYSVMRSPDNREVWESYAENRTPAAWWVCRLYGPDQDQITIVSITAHS